MAKNKKKPKWDKPKLVILTRGKPEETMVGLSCKYSVGTSGPQTSAGDVCFTIPLCDRCSASVSQS